MSMEQLQQNHDAVLASAASPGSMRPRPLQSALPWVGRCLLAFAGHRPWKACRCGGFFCFAVLPMALMLLLCLAAASSRSRWNTTLAMTLGLFHLGAALASLSLRRHETELLFGPKEQQLDEYAEERGFIQEWQKASTRRLFETFLVVLFIVLFRSLGIYLSGSSFIGIMTGEEGLDVAIFPWIFWMLVIRYLMLCYQVLHAACGFQLALSSFTTRFFQELDIGEALDEWNVLQATLRQVSCKMSDSLVVMALSSVCGVAVLAEQVVVTSDVVLEMVLNWLSMFYPLILFFLYTLLRAAQITENASRVAPLVNSWQFKGGGT